MLSAEGPFCPFIHAASWDRRRPPWALPQRRNTYWLLVTSFEGDEQISVEGQRHRVASGGSYLVQPGRLADIGSTAGNSPAWVHFDLQWHPQRAFAPYAPAYTPSLAGRERFLQPDARAVFGVDLQVLAPPPVDALIRSEMPQMQQCWRRGCPLARGDAALRIARLLLIWAGNATAESRLARLGSGSAGEAEGIRRVERLLLERLDQPASLSYLARIAGLSRTRFAEAFRRLRGETVGAYVRRQRLCRAEALLREHPELTVADIGRLVGIADPASFCRFFRRQHDCAPDTWRRSLKPQIGG